MKNILMILIFVGGGLAGYLLSAFSNKANNTDLKFSTVDTILTKDTIYKIDTVFYDGYEDGFVEFVAQFEKDSIFRIESCMFPLQVSFWSEECGGDLDTINATLKHLDSLNFKIGPMLSSGDNWIFTKGFSKNKPNELKRKVLIKRDETGVHTEFFFQYINERWMLVAIGDSSC